MTARGVAPRATNRAPNATTKWGAIGAHNRAASDRATDRAADGAAKAATSSDRTSAGRHGGEDAPWAWRSASAPCSSQPPSWRCRARGPREAPPCVGRPCRPPWPLSAPGRWWPLGYLSGGSALRVCMHVEKLCSGESPSHIDQGVTLWSASAVGSRWKLCQNLGPRGSHLGPAAFFWLRIWRWAEAAEFARFRLG